jgi:KDO2-lipid IV(A) lauroyltransferase
MPSSIEGEINPNNAEACLRAHKAGKGILLLVLHMGNWEACGRWLTRNLPAVNAITRRQKPEWFAELVHETRKDIGYHEIDNKNALRPSLRALRNGEMVIMLIDHYIRRGAVQVDFFGHPAMTSAAAALLAMKTGCAVLVGACYRNGDGSWGCEFSDPVETLMTGNRERDYIANTQRYVDIMEQFVRQHPGDWMWMHNRWKKPRGPIRAMEPLD